MDSLGLHYIYSVVVNGRSTAEYIAEVESENGRILLSEIKIKPKPIENRAPEGITSPWDA